MKRHSNNDASMIFGGLNKPPCFEVQNPSDPIFYLYGCIGDELDYVDMIHAIRYAQPGQRITIHINSPGGNLNVCLAIVNAINYTQGEVTTVLDGEASSAAAMVWLAGHVKIIASKHTILMLHTASTGFHQSKIPEIKGNVEIIIKIMEGLLVDLTKGFLTDAELADIRKGVDVWFTGEELMNRFPYEQEIESNETD